MIAAELLTKSVYSFGVQKIYTAMGKAPSCPDGRTDGNQKCPLIFFIFRYIKHYTHIYLNVYKKIVLTNVLWVLNFGQVGGPDAKIQKHTLGWIFFKSY